MKLDLTPAEARRVLNSRDHQKRKVQRKGFSLPKLEKRVNPKATRGREIDKGYLAYLRRQPCEACGSVHRIEATHVRSGYSEAGWPATGMQVKPSDARALSLCASCHREGPDAQHRTNERAWWAARGIYPPTRCAEVYADFAAGRDQPRRGA